MLFRSHWSEQTQVIAIKGTATGQLNQENFGVQDGPIIPATTYTMNDGDSGRITYVGKSLSGLDLDMIYTVASSDKDSWQANEGAEGIPQGLTFTGEQNIAESGGNSIVCLYNGANALSLIYQIVKHDTTTYWLAKTNVPSSIEIPLPGPCSKKYHEDVYKRQLMYRSGHRSRQPFIPADLGELPSLIKTQTL